MTESTIASPPSTPADPAADVLRAQVDDLAQARHSFKTHADRLRTLEAEFQAVNAAAIDEVKTARAQVAALEEGLRAAALARFGQTHEKAVAPGVAIRITRKVEYDDAQAFAFAKEKSLYLSLNVSAFEKLAIASPESVPFATITETPAVTLATDLDAALLASAK